MLVAVDRSHGPAGEHGLDRVATVRAVLAGHLDRAGAEIELARSLRPL